MLENFACGLLCSDLKTRKIFFANQYLIQSLLFEKAASFEDDDVENIFTKGAQLFIESYLYPSLVVEKELVEVQLVLKNALGKRVPVVVNVKLIENRVYWTILTSIKRDELYDELIEIKDRLELKTEALAEAAFIDPLTKLLNRRAGLKQGHEAFVEAKENNSTIALFMLDVDFFKNINDQYGHAKGDEVLILMSEALSAMHCEEIVIRWSGEEILILASSITLAKAQDMCQKIKTELSNIQTGLGALKVSIGTAVVSLSSESKISFDEALAAADKMLYQAKHHGRDRAEFIELPASANGL